MKSTVFNMNGLPHLSSLYFPPPNACMPVHALLVYIIVWGEIDDKREFWKVDSDWMKAQF